MCDKVPQKEQAAELIQQVSESRYNIKPLTDGEQRCYKMSYIYRLRTNV